MQEATKKDQLLYFGEITDDLAGYFHPVSSVDIQTGMRSPLFGYMVLNEHDLGVGIVTHECLHAAFALERLNFFSCSYGNDCLKDEERLAHLLTDVVRGVYNTLYEHGHIKEVKRG